MMDGITRLYLFQCGSGHAINCEGEAYYKRRQQRWAIVDARIDGWVTRKSYNWVCPECRKHLDLAKKEGRQP